MESALAINELKTYRSLSLLLAFSAVTAGAVSGSTPADWLLDPAGYSARIAERDAGQTLVLSNGLIRREIRVTPNAATVAFDNLMTSQSELRSVRPEATVTIDGTEYPVGGLSGQPAHNFILPRWLDEMTAVDGAFVHAAHRIGPTRERFPWKPRKEWLSREAPWPPPGKSLSIDFEPPSSGPAGIHITVHYELYDGIPLLSKWISIRNDGSVAVTIDALRSEILAWVEPASLVEGGPESFLPFPRSLHVESEYSFGGSLESGMDGPGFAWKPDPLYATQVHYQRQMPCLLECGPPVGPGVKLEPGAVFEAPRIFELVYDSTERERRGLAQRRMYRVIAPWVQENPLIFHAGSAQPDAVRAAVDQAAEVGFELVIMTFGSGFNAENENPEYRQQVKELADYAHAKGVGLGGYSLLASRSIDADNDVVNPETNRTGGFARFGNSPCLGSSWGRDYFRKLYALYETTGLDVLEHDGNYPGDVCASTTHPGHTGLADSQWTQWKTISDFYRWCRGRGVYLNVPDWYYAAGSSKCGMGYRETNWSLPRAQQAIIERQNIYDGTWSKTPSMGWMFVPLMEYHGGGPAATIEPLDAHRDHYAQRLDNLLGAGVQACFRGPRLFDTPATRDMLRNRVQWFKQHRAILESDILHGRRADGRDLDWITHVNPRLETPAMIVVHNPTDDTIERAVPIDLYYAGIERAALAIDERGDSERIALDARGRGNLRISVPPQGMAWRALRRVE